MFKVRNKQGKWLKPWERVKGQYPFVKDIEGDRFDYCTGELFVQFHKEVDYKLVNSVLITDGNVSAVALAEDYEDGAYDQPEEALWHAVLNSSYSPDLRRLRGQPIGVLFQSSEYWILCIVKKLVLADFKSIQPISYAQQEKMEKEAMFYISYLEAFEIGR